YVTPRSPRSLPARRSSDLVPAKNVASRSSPMLRMEQNLPTPTDTRAPARRGGPDERRHPHAVPPARSFGAPGERVLVRLVGHLRSEEHTSELQSRENLVCR